MSQVTTHILDTTRGKPAEGVAISMYQQTDAGWDKIASGITNADGRIPDLLGTDVVLAPGVYKMLFEVQPYFDALSIKAFYPFVEIVFYITSAEHYHIPLLLNPFGYSTYRGS